MERLAIISNNSFRAIGFNKRRSPSSPYGPAPQGSQLITLNKSTSSLPSSNLKLAPLESVPLSLIKLRHNALQSIATLRQRNT